MCGSLNKGLGYFFPLESRSGTEFTASAYAVISQALLSERWHAGVLVVLSGAYVACAVMAKAQDVASVSVQTLI